MLDAAGNDVTAQFTVKQLPGTLTIAPREATVTIKGNSGTVTYDGAEHEVTGYEVTAISDPLYTDADFAFKGDATAKGTAAGTYAMGLTPANFHPSCRRQATPPTTARWPAWPSLEREPWSWAWPPVAAMTRTRSSPNRPRTEQLATSERGRPSGRPLS